MRLGKLASGSVWSPCCEEQKSRARSEVDRPRQDLLGLHAVTTSVPLTNTSLDNLPTRDSAKPQSSEGKRQGTAVQFLHGCVQLHHWMLHENLLND